MNTYRLFFEPDKAVPQFKRLHFEEVERIVNILNQLIETGNSVLVIEHNLELIKCADYVIDLGPEAGDEGGEIMVTGTPEELLSKQDKSHTALFLPPYLSGGKPIGTISNKDKERYLHNNPLKSI